MAVYKRSSTYAWVFVVMVFAGIGVGMGLMIALHPYQDQIQGWILLIASAPTLVTFFMALAIVGRITKGRQLLVQEALQFDGFYFELDPTPESREEFFGPLNHLVTWAGLQTGTAGILWLAHAEGRRVCVFEHEFTTGSGKYSTVHSNTIACWYGGLEEPVGARLANVGKLSATRPVLGMRRAMLRDGASLETGEAAFDKKWVIFGDPAMVVLFFTDEVRRWLADSPKGERWLLGVNWAVCAFSGHFDAENIRLFIQRARGVLETTTALPWADDKEKE